MGSEGQSLRTPRNDFSLCAHLSAPKCWTAHLLFQRQGNNGWLFFLWSWRSWHLSHWADIVATSWSFHSNLPCLLYTYQSWKTQMTDLSNISRLTCSSLKCERMGFFCVLPFLSFILLRAWAHGVMIHHPPGFIVPQRLETSVILCAISVSCILFYNPTCLTPR